MASPNDFLVVAGTAAPVIALANVVLIQGLIQVVPAFSLPPLTPRRARITAIGIRLMTVVLFGSSLNYAAQASVLGYALFFLSSASRRAPARDVQFAMIGGISFGLLALLVVGTALAVAQYAGDLLKQPADRRPAPAARVRPPGPARRVRPAWQRRGQRLNPSGSSSASGK